MTKITSLVSSNSTLAVDLRKLADEIESGEKVADTALVVFRSRTSESIGRTICGDVISYSAMMGLLTYATHMLFGECQQ